MRNSLLVSKPIWWLLLSVVSAGSMAYYVTEIWSANQPPHFNDLYAPWWGAHELMWHGRNPYSPEVAHEIQSVIYGAPATSTAPDDPANIAGGFAYPPYAALLLWPTLHLTFVAAQRVFLLASFLLTLLSVTLWLRPLHVALSPARWITIALFALGSFPALQALQLQNLSLIASALIAITIFLLTSDRLVLAGVVLAASTFKPQFTIALVPWLALWTLGDWRRRRPMVWGFLSTMFLLGALSEWMVPGWIRSFLTVIRAYRHYTYGHSLLDVWFGLTWGPATAACLLLAVLLLCWKHRSLAADSPRIILVTSLVLAATVVVIPTLAPHTQLLLLPGMLCLWHEKDVLFSGGTLRRLALAATWILLAWPWAATLGLTLAAVRYPARTLLGYWEVPVYTSPLLPLAVLLALCGLLFTPPKADPRAPEALESRP